MSIIGPVPFTFVNGTVADGTQVNANFEALVTAVNANAQPIITTFTGSGNYVLDTGATLTGATITGSFTGGLIGNASTATTAGSASTATFATTAGSASTATFATTAGNVVTNANLSGPVTSSGNNTSISNSINLPGNPTTTTQASGTNNGTIATTAFVAAASGGGSLFKTITVTGITASGAVINIPANALPVFALIYVHGSVYGMTGNSILMTGSGASTNQVDFSGLSYSQIGGTFVNQMFAPMINDNCDYPSWFTVASPTTMTVTTDNGSWNLATSGGGVGATATVDIDIIYIST